MKAAELNVHPAFQLMKQSDIVAFYHMQMPRWLFTHPSYAGISLEAKVAYTFLLNRFQLSRLNGWVNSDQEVFVIFTRESLAAEMRVSYRKAIECFKELAAAGLIWEKRVGRGNANQIYLAAVELSEADTYSPSAPFSNPEGAPIRSAEPAHQEGALKPSGEETGSREPALDMPNPQVCNCQNRSSACAEPAGPELPNPQANYIDQSDIELIQNDTSQSVPGDLARLLCRSGVEELPADIGGVFRNAIERLWYSKQFTVGGTTLPQEKIRRDLVLLHPAILVAAWDKLRGNEQEVKNSTAYVMAVLLNTIWEYESDILVDPDLNRLDRHEWKGG